MGVFCFPRKVTSQKVNFLVELLPEKMLVWIIPGRTFSVYFLYETILMMYSDLDYFSMLYIMIEAK